MIRLQRSWLLLALMTIACTSLASERTPATAAPSPEHADTALAGHYYLDGVIETGSELLLRSDGRFQWMMSYGALDQYAEGRWSRRGDRVLLQNDATDPQSAFETLSLRIDGKDLIPAWPWDDGKERGRYTLD